MNISNARYADETSSTIIVEINGIQSCVPVDRSNRHYQEIVRRRLGIAQFQPEL